MKSGPSQNRKAIIDGGDYTPIPNELIRCRHMAHTTYRVYSIITSFDPSYPSIRLICRLGGFGKSTVLRAIEWLESNRIITYRPGGSKRKTNEYFVLDRQKWDIPAPEGIEDESGNCSTTGTGRICDGDGAVPAVGTPLSPPQVHNKSNTKKSNLKKSKEEIYYDIGKANGSLPSHFISEAVAAYQKIFAERYSGQRYLGQFSAQFENTELQNAFVEQSIQFSLYGGTIYGRIQNEFDRLVSQKTRHTPQPKHLITDSSISTYQTALKDHLSRLKWPDLIQPFSGKFLKSASFDDDSEAVFAIKTINKVLALKGIEAFERWRWETQPPDVVQFGPYLFNYYIVKSYLHFGFVPPFFNKVLLDYEKKIGVRLFRPDEQMTIKGLDLRPRSLWEVYAPKARRLKSRDMALLKKRIYIPGELILNLSEENQQLHKVSKGRDTYGESNIKSRSHSTALGEARE